MLSFFRRGLSSWFLLGLLGLVMIAFIVTGVEAPSAMGGAGSGPTVAKAGGTKISASELLRRVQNQFDGMRREQPELTHKAFVEAGRFDAITNELISARAVDDWGKDHGFAVSKRLIDAEIAAIPAFAGPTGKFDESMMRARLGQARVSEKDLRGDFNSEILRNQMLSPAVAAAGAPQGLAAPYATLLLEQRVGSVAIIPLAALADTRQPTEAEIAAAYKANIAGYTRPEGRSLRYALFGPAQIAAAAVPTEAEIATYYRDHAENYAARQTRTLSQVITPDQKIAAAVAAAAKAGTPLTAAAAKSGLEATTIAGKSRADYAATANDAIAAAAFAAPQGGVAGPIKGAFGWYVVRVDAVTGTPARSLDQVRAEIAAELGKQKAADAMSELGGKIEDAIADGSSFAEIAASNKLTIVETPVLLANGQPLEPTDWKPTPEAAALLRTGFAASPEERPTVETVVPDQLFALLSVAKVVPPTPLPLAQVREVVARDIIVKRTAARAKALGQRIVAAVNKGTPLAKAIADSGVKLPAPQPARARQLDLARASQSGQQIPPPVQALFTLRPGKAKLVPGDNPGVMFVTALETITPGDLASTPGLAEATRAELARNISPELASQFVRALQNEAGVKRYPDAISAAKRQFTSGGQ